MGQITTGAIPTKVSGDQLSAAEFEIVRGAHNATDLLVAGDSTHRFVTDAEKTAWNAKQAALVSATNIKTINGTSILGAGDLAIAGASVPYANIMDFGAVGDGVADDLAALNAAIATGLDVYIPGASVKYSVSAAPTTLAVGQNVFGDGWRSFLYFASYSIVGNMFTCPGKNMIRGIHIECPTNGPWPGTNPAVYTMNGVKATGNYVQVIDCIFKLIFGGGAHMAGTQGLVSNCYFEAVDAGVILAGEYNHVGACVGYANNYAVLMSSGNNTINGFNIKGGGGIYVLNISNGDHTSIIGVTANHMGAGTPSLFLDSVAIGLAIIGCNFFDGEIKIDDCLGVSFQGCLFGTSCTFTVTGTQSECTFFNNNVMAGISLPSGAGIKSFNNYGPGAGALVAGATDFYLPVNVNGTAYYLKLLTAAP